MSEKVIEKPHYNLMFETIRTVIHEWDPYGLIRRDAPQDEFDREIACIVRQVSRIHSSNDAIDGVSRVFSSSFEPHLFKPEDCKQVGERLYQALKAKALLE